MSLSDKLKLIKFKGFHDVDWSEVLMRTSIEEECGLKHGVYYYFFDFLVNTFRGYKYNCDYVNNNSKFLFHLHYPTRKSNDVQFFKVVSVVNGDYIIEKASNKRLHICEFLVLLFSLYPFWLFNLSGKGLTFIQKLIVMNKLRFLYGQKIFIDTIDFSRYKLLTSFYDSMPSSNYLLHVCRLKNIKSATLQHGSFNRYVTDVLEWSGIEFRSMFSDYFLAWNLDQRNEALAQGVADEKIKVVGIIGYIDQKYCKCLNPENKIFGVVISHPTWEKENFELIKAANKLAEAIGYKYYLKLHPNYPSDYFDNYINNKFYLGNVVKGIPILEYANSVEFSLIGSTSVLIELVYLSHSTLHYSSGEPSDKFKYVKVGYNFSGELDIVDVFNQMKANSNIASDDVFDYLCTVKDVGDSYRKFYSQFDCI